MRTNTRIGSREAAESFAELSTNRGHPTVTLEALGDASIIDQLDLNDDVLVAALKDPLEKLAKDRPELAERFCDGRGRAIPEQFVSWVWRQGLSTQYANEADGWVAAINAAPFEKQTWFTHERPALLENEQVDRDQIIYLDITHAPLSEKDVANGQRSQVLMRATGPITDRDAKAHIDFTRTPPPRKSSVPEIRDGMSAKDAAELKKDIDQLNADISATGHAFARPNPHSARDQGVQPRRPPHRPGNDKPHGPRH